MSDTDLIENKAAAEVFNPKGDGYTIRIRDTPIMAGRNYVSIEIINPKGEHEGFCVPISVVRKQMFKDFRILGTVSKDFVENLPNV